MSDNVPYDSMADVFAFSGSAAGLDGLVTYLRDTGKHHAHFRTLLLRKRFELGLPLINPGELTGYPAHVRKTYEDFVEETCRQTGERYLEENNIPQAWRYFRTIGEREPIRKALEK